jgi:prepilin-type processing-associated H-X9-DG protein
MTDPMHHQILGHLFGALDDDEQQSVESCLEHDERWRRELSQWRQRLAPLEALRPDFEPPPGLAERTCRFVAACMPAPAKSLGRRWSMSPHPMPPHRVARFRGLDVAVVTTLLVMLGAMIPPAIHSSRHGARVAFCQDDLRHFGQALADHGQRQGQALSQLANRGQLTRTGLFAAELLQDAYLTATHRTVCPDAWLAVQGLLRGESRGTSLKAESPAVEPAGPKLAVAGDWSDAWRDDASDGWRPPASVSTSPLLADAPSADLPGQGFPSHGGRGRNVLFEDGHAEFLSAAGSSGVADSLIPGGEEDPANHGGPTPLILVHGR